MQQKGVSSGRRSASRGSRNRSAGRRVPEEETIEFAESYAISPAEARELSRSKTPDHPPDCLCTICTCGAHRCPPDRLQGRYTNLKSEHQAQFTGQYVPPSRPQKEAYVHHPRPFVATTTNQDDYCYWGNAPPRKAAEGARRTNDVFGKNLPFDGVTTNQHDFRRWNQAPAKPSREQHSSPVMVQDNRDFGTEVSTQFDYKNCQPRISCAPTQTLSDPLPFEGHTTNNVDYVHHRNVTPARSTQRQRMYAHRSEDRDWSTEARQQYVKKPFDPCPAKPLYSKTKDMNGHVTVERIPHTRNKWQLSTVDLPVMQQSY